MSKTFYDRMPAVGGAMLRAVASKPGLRDPSEMPALAVQLSGYAVDPAWVARYAALTGLPAGQALPATAPQHVAFPLHMALLTDRAFPLRVLGAVHVRQVIEQVRPLRADERAAIGVRIGDARQARRGIELDLITEFDVEGQTIWRGTTTMLALGAGNPEPAGSGAGRSKAKGDDAVPADPTISTIVRLQADLGRRFAAVAGDRNPIHLYPWTARPFGFKRPIIHGMWSMARALAALDQHAQSHDLRLTCQFRRPLALPGSARICAWPHDHAEWRFAILDGRGRLALEGAASSGAMG